MIAARRDTAPKGSSAKIGAGTAMPRCLFEVDDGHELTFETK
jgi:hypothetical protein